MAIKAIIALVGKDKDGKDEEYSPGDVVSLGKKEEARLVELGVAEYSSGKEGGEKNKKAGE